MNPCSAKHLVEMSPKEAAHLLAQVAGAARAQPLTYSERQKLAYSDVLSALGRWIKENPVPAASLLGTGAGALVGGGATLLGNRGKRKENKRSLLSGLLTGGLAGGALGLGGSLLAQNWPQSQGAGPPASGIDPDNPPVYRPPGPGSTLVRMPRDVAAGPPAGHAAWFAQQEAAHRPPLRQRVSDAARQLGERILPASPGNVSEALLPATTFGAPAILGAMGAKDFYLRRTGHAHLDWLRPNAARLNEAPRALAAGLNTALPNIQDASQARAARALLADTGAHEQVARNALETRTRGQRWWQHGPLAPRTSPTAPLYSAIPPPSPVSANVPTPDTLSRSALRTYIEQGEASLRGAQATGAPKPAPLPPPAAGWRRWLGRGLMTVPATLAADAVIHFIRGNSAR